MYSDGKWQSLLVSSGAKWARVAAPYLPRFTSSHPLEVMQVCKRLGIKVLSIIGKKTTDTDTGPTSEADWRLDVKYALDTYGQYLDAVEVWNEPPLSGSWQGIFQGQPDVYVMLLRVVYEEVQNFKALGRVSPNLKIVAGVLNNAIVGSKADTFFHSIRRSNPSSDVYADVYSFHVYDERKPIRYATVQQANFVSWCNGSGKDIWMTEGGCQYSTDGTGQEQVNYVERLATLDKCKVKIYFIYADVSYLGTQTWGLLDRNLNQRPAYQTFKTL